MAANKVFIVEDDAVIARAVAAHLTTWQMQVQCAGNFEKITEEVEDFQPDIIIMAMNMGGDDFIAKPFDLQVLTAKLQAVLRRSYGSKLTSHSIECGEVVLNLNDTSVAVRGEKIDLTKNEFLILKTLMEKQGKVVSREEIMERLWGNDEFVDDNTLTVMISSQQSVGLDIWLEYKNTGVR